MNDFPKTLHVGRPARTQYELRANELLLHLRSDSEGPRVSRLLAKLGLREKKTSSRRGPDLLHAANLRWVELAKPTDSLRGLARDLMRKHDEIAFVTPVYTEAGQGLDTAASPCADRIVLELRDDTRDSGLDQLRELGLEHDPVMSKLLAPFHLFRVHLGERYERDALSVLEALSKQREHVAFAELDWLRLQSYQLVPSDALWANQWDMAIIGTPGAWDVTTGAAAVTVAIIDSGFDLTHPDLTFGPVGTHFNADQAIGGVMPPYNAGSAGVFHGTAVAGIAAASVNNGIGVAGVAGGCTIMPVRLGTTPTSVKVTAGVNWAATNGAQVANMSLMTVATAAAQTAMTNAWTAGMVLCAATGNGGGNTTSPAVGFPANHPNVIAVGASDQSDQRKRPASVDAECWGSQFDANTDVVAPGVQCWTTDEQGASGYNNNAGGAINWSCNLYPSSGDATGNYVALFNGTSAATPHVTGLAALLRSAYPALGNQQVRDIIERTCDKVSPGLYPYAHVAGRNNGTWHQEVGYGRINCDAALHYADLVITDHPFDTGAVPSSEWTPGGWSPTAFWRHQPYVTTTSMPGAMPGDHEPAKPGQDNYVHAVISNQGPADATNLQITWHLMDYPGTELIWPTDWNPGNQIASTSIAALPAGSSQAVQAPWPQALVDVGATHAHPCMVVQVTCAQDRGGDLGDYVYQYNNIAQHNISFASFNGAGPGNEPEADRRFTLPFGAGHPTAPARIITLAIDTRKAKDAEVTLELEPPRTLPHIPAIEAASREGVADEGCGAVMLTDATMLMELCGCRAKVRFKAGSKVELLCRSEQALTMIDTGTAKAIVRDGRRQLLLQDELTLVRFSVEAGVVVPLAVNIEAPSTAQPGDRYVVDVTQISEQMAVGGVTLDVSAK